MKTTLPPARTRLFRALPILSASILTLSTPWLTAANPDTWNNFNAIQQWSVGGNWLDLSSPLTGDPTADLTFGGTTAYTANNDLVGFFLNTLTLNATVAESITGNSMDFRLDDTAAGIAQNGAGGFTIGTDIVATSALGLGGTGSGIVTLNGVLGGAGGISVNAGTWQLGNVANSFSGGLTVNTGATLEAISSAAGNQAVNLTPAATGYLGSNAGNAITINGGTLKITTKGTGGITMGGRSLTFGANGGTFDIRNTSGIAGTQGGGIVGGDLNLTLNNTLANTAVVKFSGGQLGLSNNSLTDGNWATATNCLRFASLNGSGPLRVELTNGAMMRSSFASTTLPVTIRGVGGGDPTSGPAGTAVSGVSTTLGRVALDTVNEHSYSSLRFEGAVQVGVVGTTRALNGSIVVAGSAGGNAGYVAFTGRGTGTELTSTLNAPGTATAGQNPLWLFRAGAASNAGSLTIEGGGIAAFDTRLRSDAGGRNGNGVVLDGPAIIAAGGTLRFLQSVSNFTTGAAATNSNCGDVVIFGDITGQGTTAKESVVSIALPEPQAGALISSGVPIALSGTATTTAAERPYGGLRFDDSRGSADFIVNGSGFGGLRINSAARPNATIQGNAVDPVDGNTKINSVLTPTRLSRVSGSGGYLTVAPTGQTYAFPNGGEWTSANVGLKVVNHNAGGTDVSLGALSTWGKNLAVDAGATLETGAALSLISGTLAGTGTVISTGGTLTVGSGATVAPGFSVGTITVGNITLNGALQIETTNAPTSDLLAVAGNLTLGGTSVLSLPFTNTFGLTNYTIATYAGTLTGTFGTVSGLPVDYTLSYGSGANSLIRILYTPPPQEIWNGNLSGVWDTVVQNWQGPSAFSNGHKAIFDDSASGPNLIVSVSGGDVTPGQITVSNTTKDYTLISTAGSAIAGAAKLIKSGGGALTLSGPATYIGGTAITNGTVKLGSNDALPDSGLVSVSAGATLDTQGNSDTVADLSVDGAATGTGTLTVASLTLGSGAAFAPNLVLNGPLTKSGAAASVVGGTVNLGAAERAITVASGTAPELTLNGVVSNGSLTKSGNGTLVLGNAGNTFSGGTTLSAGTLKVGIAGAIPSANPLIVNGGTLSGNNTALAVFSLAGTGGTVSLGSGSLVIAQSVDTTYSGAITGIASVTKSDGGILTLNGSGNTYSGGLYATGGVVIVASVSAPGTGVSHVQTGGTLQVGATLTNPILLEGGILATQNSPGQVTSNDLTAATSTTSTILLAPATNLGANSEVILLGTLRGGGNVNVVAGSANFAPDGGPGFRLRGTGPSDFTGTITAAQSVKLEIQTAVAGAFSPAGAGKFVLTGGTYNAGTLGGIYSVINIRNNSTGTAIPGNDFAIAGADYAMFNMPGGSPAGAITMLGNLMLGDTQAVGVYRNTGNAQVLQFTSVTLTGGNATFAPNPVGFATSGSASLVLGPIGESVAGSSIVQGGNGRTTLTGAGGYTGTTAVNAGTLQVGDGGTTGSLGTGAVTDNALLIFNRSNTLDVPNAISGSGTVTNSGSGVLNLNGAQDYAVLNANAGITNVKGSFTAGTATVNANARLNFVATETIGALVIADGVAVNVGAIAGFSPEDLGGASPPAIEASALGLSAQGGAQAVPEPGTLSLLVFGAVGLFGRRRK